MLQVPLNHSLSRPLSHISFCLINLLLEGQRQKTISLNAITIVALSNMFVYVKEALCFRAPLSPLTCISRISLRAAGLLSLTCKGHCGVDSEVTDQYNIHLLVSCKQLHEGQFTPGLCLTNMSRDHPMQIMLTAA